MEKLEFNCCFCNQGIIENNVDPLDINIMHNIDVLNKTRREQTFYAHFDCLKEKLHPYSKEYFFKFEDGNYNEIMIDIGQFYFYNKISFYQQLCVLSIKKLIHYTLIAKSIENSG